MSTFQNASFPRTGVAAAFGVFAAALLSALPIQAASFVFTINATGAQEVNGSGVPNQGDPDGLSSGTLTLDSGTGAGNTGSASFNLTLTNIDISDLRGHHIHQNVAGANGPIVLDFGDPDLIRTGNVLSGTITGLSATIIDSVFANPAGFYYNTHNSVYTGGAVRDQLAVPEPGTVALLTLGAGSIALGLRRRRRADRLAKPAATAACRERNRGRQNPPFARP